MIMVSHSYTSLEGHDRVVSLKSYDCVSIEDRDFNGDEEFTEMVSVVKMSIEEARDLHLGLSAILGAYDAIPTRP